MPIPRIQPKKDAQNSNDAQHAQTQLHFCTLVCLVPACSQTVLGRRGRGGALPADETRYAYTLLHTREGNGCREREAERGEEGEGRS